VDRELEKSSSPGEGEERKPRKKSFLSGPKGGTGTFQFWEKRTERLRGKKDMKGGDRTEKKKKSRLGGTIRREEPT